MLHIIKTSPYQDNHLKHCLDKASDDDGIILIQEAIYGLNHPLLISREQVYFLEEDATARGISPDNANSIAVDYSGFVELTLKYSKTMSW